MGFDIFVYRVEKHEDKNYKCKQGERVVNFNDKELEKVKTSPIGHLLSRRVMVYSDWNQLPVADERRYELVGVESGPDNNYDSIYSFRDKQHELFPLTDKIWDIKEDTDITEDEWNLLKKYGFDGKFDDSGKQWKYEPLYKFLLDTAYIHYKESEVPKITREEDVLYGIEVGYQSRGMNRAFFHDMREGKIGCYVFTKKELNRYKKDYCDAKEKETIGEKKQQTITTYPKARFQRNIIDHFTEGECFVIFG